MLATGEGIIFHAIFLLLLSLSDEVLALLETLDLELVALGPLVDIPDIICEQVRLAGVSIYKRMIRRPSLPVVDSKWLEAS